MMKQKQVGNWTLLETESSPLFVNYANNNDKNESGFKYNSGVLVKPLKYCKNKRTVIDIGASYGYVSNELSFAFDNVISFEIVPEIRECLQINMKDKSNVEIFDTGLSDFTGRVKLNFYPKYTGHTTSKLDKVSELKKEEIVCRVKPLDSHDFQNNIDFIKIDVEGAEINVLRGAKNTIMKNLPVIMLEIHGNSAMNAIKIAEFLTELNYKCVEQYRDDYIFIQKE